ncbi:MAG: twin-arginine translocation signal domain-containing protein, partial [Planctomycetaceae bacterium]
MPFRHCSRTSRRDFLKLTGTAAGLTAAGPLAARGWGGEERDPYGGFQMCLQSYSLRAFDVTTALSHSQKLGLRFWESFPGHIPLSTVPAHVRQHKAMLKDANVTLLSYGVVSFDENESKAREVFDFAQVMGLVSISANPKKLPAVF